MPDIIQRLMAAMRPILIPFEEQDMAIQAENTKLVEKAATAAWMAYLIAEMEAREKAG
jgi:hypothetical protein